MTSKIFLSISHDILHTLSAITKLMGVNYSSFDNSVNCAFTKRIFVKQYIRFIIFCVFETFFSFVHFCHFIFVSLFLRAVVLVYWIESSWYVRWNLRLSVIPIQINICFPYLAYLAIIIRDIYILCVYHWHIFILGLLIHSVYFVLEFSYLRLLCNNLTFRSILTSRCALAFSFDLLNLWLCCGNACIQKVLLFV